MANLSLITSLLFVILLSNEFVHYLNQAASGKFAPNILWKLVILEFPRFLSVLLPFSLFLSLLITYSRLYTDSEMTVLKACGFGLRQLMQLTLPLVILLTFIISLLSLWLNPWLLSYRNKLLIQSGTEVELQTIQPGTFQQSMGGRRIIYVESSAHKTVHNIFMAQLSPHPSSFPITPWIILSADKGYQTYNPSTKENFFVAVNGNRYQGVPGKFEYYITHFSTYGIRTDYDTVRTSNKEDSLSTLSLWRLSTPNKPNYFSELQWRLAAPISTLLLALLAVSLSQFSPRQGKYLHLLPALIIYLIYINLLLIGRNWVENNEIPYGLGLWWIHSLLLIVIALAWYCIPNLKKIKDTFSLSKTK